MIQPGSEKQKPSEVTVEQLLRLKRAEKPGPDFWEDFDRRLRERTLQTLAWKEPWPARWARQGLRRAWAAAPAAALLVAAVLLAPSGPGGDPGNPRFTAGQRNAAPDSPPSAAGEEDLLQSSRPSFVVDIAPNDSARDLSFIKVMAPASLTAERSRSVVYVADPLLNASPTVRRTTPSHNYF